MSGRGRPHRDVLALVEEIAALHRADPTISLNKAQQIVGARRNTVRRIIRVLRASQPESAPQYASADSSAPGGSEVVPQFDPSWQGREPRAAAPNAGVRGAA